MVVATVTQLAQEEIKPLDAWRRTAVGLLRNVPSYFWMSPLKLTGNPRKVPVDCIRTAAMLTQTAAPSATVKSESHMAPAPLSHVSMGDNSDGGEWFREVSREQKTPDG